MHHIAIVLHAENLVAHVVASFANPHEVSTFFASYRAVVFVVEDEHTDSLPCAVPLLMPMWATTYLAHLVLSRKSFFHLFPVL